MLSPAPELVEVAAEAPPRRRASLAWFGHPAAYAACSPILTLLGAGTMLLAPWLLAPAAFGQFALLTTIMQSVAKTDLGLSQLADRDLAARSALQSPDRPDAILRARWIVAIAVFAVLAPVLLLSAWMTGRFGAADAMLTLVGSSAAMVAVGPVTVFRAQGRIRDFTLASLALQAVMTAPRLLGLVIAGVTGCFAMLAAWFGLAAAVLALPALRRAPRAPVLPLVRSALPMFVFSWSWLTYLLVNRWISSGLSDPDHFGLFAFGANLSVTAIGVLSSVAQVRYPALLAQAEHGPRGAAAAAVEREAALLATALAGAAACAIPLVPAVIGRVFPHYLGGDVATMIQALACVPLGVVAWYMPVVVALARAPVAEAARTLAPAFAALAVGMAVGQHRGGIEGQAWGCVAGALVLLTGLVGSLARLGILDRVRAVRLVVLVAAEVAVLAVLVVAVDPRRIQASLADTDQVPPKGWPVVFEDRFESLRLWDRTGGVWQPSYPSGARANASNQEMQYYVDPRPGRDRPDLQALAPLRVDGGSVVLSARPLAKHQSAPMPGAAYLSGMLTTARSFSFRYGYAEIEAQVPRGKGVWPGFWMLPVAGGWPPEIDVMEVLGDDTDGYWATLHSGAHGRDEEIQGRVRAADLSRGFHTYGVRWTAETIDWFLDRRRVFSAPTPPDFHAPMYLLVQLAVGGKWPGAPDAGTPFPAEFKVRRVSVFGQPKSDSRNGTESGPVSRPGPGRD